VQLEEPRSAGGPHQRPVAGVRGGIPHQGAKLHRLTPPHTSYGNLWEQTTRRERWRERCGKVAQTSGLRRAHLASRRLALPCTAVPSIAPCESSVPRGSLNVELRHILVSYVPPGHPVPPAWHKPAITWQVRERASDLG
jgi:hypothetical protein